MKAPFSFFKYSRLLAAVTLAVVLLGPATASANLTPSPFESSDGNLTVDTPNNQDWVNAPNRVTGIDLPTGQNDNSFGQGAKEDIPGPTVVSGSIPNNKSDLTRFYVSNGYAGGDNFLYLAWERANTLGTANIDFEFNQSAVLGGNNTTPVRTAGDILITFDFVNGGGKPVLGLLRWVTSGSTSQCFSSNSLPCWGNRKDLSAARFAEGAVNTSSVPEPLAGGTLAQLTFGEAGIDLTSAGVFPANQCVHFGSAFVKSRSSASFTAELKDFIAPIPVDVQNCATIKIHKQDDSTSPVALQGAVFTLSPNNAANTYTCKTDASGNCSIVNVLPGTYSVVETTTPANYNTADPQTVNVVSGAVISLTFVDPRKPANIVITKVDDTGALLPLATFTASNGSGATFSCTTDNTGKCTISNILPLGTYTVHETVTPAGYSTAPDRIVTLGANQTLQLTFTDPRKPATVNIHKLDDSTPPVALQGAVFTLYANNVQTTFTCKTDASGNCSITNILPPGSYTVVETFTPSGYTTASPQLVDLPLGQTVNLTFVNPRMPASVKIIKKDDSSAGIPIPNATFTLYNGGTVTNFSCTTLSDGTCTISGILPVGAYTVRETFTPAGYATAADQTVTLSLGQLATVTFVDKRLFHTIVIVCQDSNSTLYPSSVTVDGVTKTSLGLSGGGALSDSALCALGGARFDGENTGNHSAGVNIPQ